MFQFLLIFWYTNLYMLFRPFYHHKFDITICKPLNFSHWNRPKLLHGLAELCLLQYSRCCCLLAPLALLDSPLLTSLSTSCKLPVGYVPQLPSSVFLLSWDFWTKAAHHDPCWFTKCVNVSHWHRTVNAAEKTLIPDAKENCEMKILQQLKCSYFIKTS